MTSGMNTQLILPEIDEFVLKYEEVPDLGKTKNDRNSLLKQDRKFHDWYRFVLSFPPHLVRNYLSKFKLNESSVVLDPFCGTGTTLIESKLKGFAGVGVEANTFSYFSSLIKTNWKVNPDRLKKGAEEIAEKTLNYLQAQGINDQIDCHEQEKTMLRKLNDEEMNLLLKNSISPLPLHKSLCLLEFIHEHKRTQFYNHLLLAFTKALVSKISNLRFGPEVGVGRIKKDIPVVRCWLSEVQNIVSDLKSIHGQSFPDSKLLLWD